MNQMRQAHLSSSSLYFHVVQYKLLNEHRFNFFMYFILICINFWINNIYIYNTALKLSKN